jgi:hypothetical protein
MKNIILNKKKLIISKNILKTKLNFMKKNYYITNNKIIPKSLII